jgi:hypothetical protein
MLKKGSIEIQETTTGAAKKNDIRNPPHLDTQHGLRKVELILDATILTTLDNLHPI